MLMNLSDRRWICVVSLAGVMLLSASEAESVPSGNKRCCRAFEDILEPDGMVACRKQASGKGCPAGYVIWINGKRKCVHSTVQWVRRRLDSGELKCPRLGLRRETFFLDVLDDDDVE